MVLILYLSGFYLTNTKYQMIVKDINTKYQRVIKDVNIKWQICEKLKKERIYLP
jgi:hypothetical protein